MPATPGRPPPADATLARARRSAVLLQALLTSQTLLVASPLARLALGALGLPIPGLLDRLADQAWCYLWLLLPEGMLWAWWGHEVHEALCAMGLRSQGEASLLLWLGSILAPFGLPLRWTWVTSLVTATRPGRLPPVLVERERPGGFRTDPVHREEAPARAQPRVTLWLPLWKWGAVPAVAVVMLVSASSPGVFVPLFVVTALAGRLLVAGVTGDLGELARRHRHRMASGAGTEPASRTTL